MFETLENGFRSRFDDAQKSAWRCMFACFQEIMTNEEPPEDIHNLVDKGTPPATPRDEDSNASHCLDDSVAPFTVGLDDAPARRKGIIGGKNDNPASKALKKEIKDHYMEMFRKEVDFHHKIAYRFEKAYRLAKETKKAIADEELDDLDADPERRRARLKQ